MNIVIQNRGYEWTSINLLEYVSYRKNTRPECEYISKLLPLDLQLIHSQAGRNHGLNVVKELYDWNKYVYFNVNKVGDISTL